MTALLECLEEDFEDLDERWHGSSSSPGHEDTSSMPNIVHAMQGSQSSDELELSPVTEHMFTVKVVKPTGVSLGLSLQEYDEGLLIERVLSDGVVDLWNSQHKGVHTVANLDQIVSINGTTGSQKMLATCSSSSRLVLEILKGPFQQKEAHALNVEVQQPEPHDDQQSVPPIVERLRVDRESFRKERAELEEDRERLAANNGATDIQQLLAERLERSRSLRS